MMNKDINYYQKELKTNIALVESNINNQQALENVADCFKNIFEQIKIFLISIKDRYYGYFIINMKLVIDFKKDILSTIDIETGELILITNPLLLGKYDIKEIIYIICHEIEHLVLYHQVESIRLNPHKDLTTQHKINIAMDTSINDRLDYEINKYKLDIMKNPKDVINSKKLSKLLNKELNELESYVYYYKEILDNMENNVSNYLESSKNNEKIIIEKNSKSKFNDLTIKIDNNEEITKILIKNIIDGIPNNIIGLIPGYQQENLSKILEKPKIPWKNTLKKFIGITPIPYKKSKLRLNRRQPERFDISGRINSQTIKIVVAIDTSKSMTNKMLEHIFIELFSILKYSKFKLTIIEFDAKVNKVYIAKKPSDINYTINGRGGTNFTKVIEYINTNNYRDALLVLFTDGFGEQTIPKPKTYRNLWIILDDKKNLSLNNPYGESITLNKEDSIL